MSSYLGLSLPKKALLDPGPPGIPSSTHQLLKFSQQRPSVQVWLELGLKGIKEGPRSYPVSAWRGSTSRTHYSTLNPRLSDPPVKPPCACLPNSGMSLYPSIHPFIHSRICSLIHPSILQFIFSLLCSFAYSSIHSYIYS